MKRIFSTLLIFTLCGCVDLGRVGLHPDMKTVFFDGHQNEVENCLYAVASGQHLSLTSDDRHANGMRKFRLQDANDQDVAWIDVSVFSSRQTSVDFFYAPASPDVSTAISAMIAQCKKSLY